MLQTASSKKSDWIHIRWLNALLGLALLIIGQFCIANEEIPLSPATKVGQWFTSQVHLSIPSVDNVLRGLPFLLAGAVLLFISLRGLKLLPNEARVANETPILLRSLRLLWPWLAGGSVLLGVLLWQINNLIYYPLMVVQWLAALLLLAVAAAVWDRRRQVTISPGVGRADALWMLGLFISSLLIGAYRLQGLPDMLIGDEGSFWTAARDIATGSFDPPVFASGVYTFPVLSSIGQAWTLKLFGIDLWGWRFGSVLAGALTVFPLYLLGRDAFNRKVAIASSIALIFSPYFLAFARLGYNNIQSLFITALALYWLYIGMQRSSTFYLLLAGCAAGFGFYTYFAARMTVVIAVLFILALWLTRKVKFRQAALAGVVLVIGAAAVSAPYITYGLQVDTRGMSFKIFESVFFNTFNGLQFYSLDELTAVAPIFKIGGNDLFYNPEIYLVLIARGLIRTLLIFQKPWLISEHFIAFPLTGTVGVIFYLLGVGALLKRFKEPRGLLMALWFLVIIFGLSILNTVPPRHTHMVNIIPLLALLTGLGANLLVNALAAAARALARWKTVSLGILTATIAMGGIYDYFFLMPERYHPQPDQVISWASLYAEDETFVYVYTDKNELAIVRPYLITEFRPEVAFKAVPYEEFRAASLAFADGRDYVIFYMPALGEDIEPLLTQAWPTSIIKRDFYSAGGAPVLSASMNTPFIFERERTFGAVLRESYGRLPLLILLGSLFVLLGLVAFVPVAWTSRLPRHVRALADWFDAPPAPLTEAEEESAEAVDESPVQPEAESPAEPPEWAEEVFPSPPARKPGRIKIEARSSRGPEGGDFYFHLHIPPLRWPWSSMPQGWRIALPDLIFPTPVWLAAAVTAAILAQIFIYFENTIAGVIFYAASAAALILWMRRNPKWTHVLTNQVRIPPRAEMVLGLALLAAVIFTRFYDLGYRVYGLEADETKWTAQSWFSTILRVDRGDFAGMHYQYLPVDFWVRSLFLRVFGLNFLSARLESALFSVVAVVFLYLLTRRLTKSPPAALLSAALYAFSFVELNGSHQALHNTTLEPWMMAGLYYLIAGIQDRKWWQFQTAGIVLALGMLTYETFFPTVLAGFVYLIGTATHQIVRRQANLRQWLPHLLVTAWPVILVYSTFTHRYLQSRRGYHFGWLNQITQGSTDIGGAALFVFDNLRDLLKTTFSGVVWQDSLLRWEGPFLNHFLLPFVVIGLVYNLCNLRRPHYVFIPLWYFVNVAIAPLLLGSVWPRVLYTSLGALILWAALGLWIFFGALRTWIGQRQPRLVASLFALTLLTIFVSDYIIFTRGIQDPLDRVKRRELSDLTTASAASADMILYPYFPAQNDSVELETHVILFSVAGARQEGLEAANRFRQVPFDQLLLAFWENQDAESLALVFDKGALALQEKRIQALEVILQCYPGGSLQSSGRFFDIYRFDAPTLGQPVCYQTPAPALASPQDGAELPAGLPVTLGWDAGNTKTTSFMVIVEQQIQNVYWIEAEDAFQSKGWYMASEFATDFTGNGFLLDNWQSGEARHSLDIARSGTYQIWVRSYKRLHNDQQNFISINGQVVPFAGQGNPLDQWAWESVGTFDLPAGPATIGLGRTYGQDAQYSVFVDAILVTSDLVNPPGPDSVWKTILAVEENRAPLDRFVIENLPAGNYRWSVRVFDGDKLIDSLGERGVAMPFARFTILP